MRLNPVIQGKQRTIRLDDNLWQLFVQVNDSSESDALEVLHEFWAENSETAINSWSEYTRSFIYGFLRAEFRMLKAQGELFDD